MKKSQVLLLVGGAATASAAVVLLFLSIAGILIGAIIIFSLLVTLIGWLKISSLRRNRLRERASFFRLSQSAVPGKVIRQFKEEREKVTA